MEKEKDEYSNMTQFGLIEIIMAIVIESMTFFVISISGEKDLFSVSLPMILFGFISTAISAWMIFQILEYSDGIIDKTDIRYAKISAMLCVISFLILAASITYFILKLKGI
jgi:hypothetical protein